VKLPPLSSAESKLEAELVQLGLNAPRVTPTMIDGMIKTIEYIMLPGNCHMICKITLNNGFSVMGESKTVSPANFNAEKAEEISYNSARNAIWPIAGAILAEDLYRGRDPLPENIQVQPEQVQLVWVELNQAMRRLKALMPLVADEDQLKSLGVDDEEINLLKQQTAFMASYSEVLQKRLARIGL
jgi:hypothetical protein